MRTRIHFWPILLRANWLIGAGICINFRCNSAPRLLSAEQLNIFRSWRRRGWRRSQRLWNGSDVAIDLARESAGTFGAFRPGCSGGGGKSKRKSPQDKRRGREWQSAAIGCQFGTSNVVHRGETHELGRPVAKIAQETYSGHQTEVLR